ncbi:hypothetical protein GCM10010869_75840 [Mesorhizobium tianshanense]|nr:hypothetical protein GCM10010869_75840 [Mesorhizobium tianshanense]
MAETDTGCVRKLGDAPGMVWIAQHHSQNLRGFRFEDRLQFAAFDCRSGRNLTLNKYAVENEPTISLEIEEPHIFFLAKSLCFWRKKGRNEHRNCALSYVSYCPLHLEQARVNVARLSARLHLTDENMCAPEGADMRKNIDFAIERA